MKLDKKIKLSTLETALRCLLRNKMRSIERTARNVIELGTSLCSETISELQKRELHKELLELIAQGEDSLEEIKNWIIEKFKLKD